MSIYSDGDRPATVIPHNCWRAQGVDRLGALVVQINAHHVTGNVGLLQHAIAAGELLIEAKRELKDRQGSKARWLPWVEEHCVFSTDTAQLYMFCAENRGRIEEALKNTERVQDFSIRNVRKLLAPPNNNGPTTNEPSVGGNDNPVENKPERDDSADGVQAVEDDPLAIPDFLRRNPSPPRISADMKLAFRKEKLGATYERIKGTSLDTPRELDALIDLGNASADVVNGNQVAGFDPVFVEDLLARAEQGEAVSAFAALEECKKVPPITGAKLIETWKHSRVLATWVRAGQAARDEFLNYLKSGVL
jgi:hypothetical protein